MQAMIAKAPRPAPAVRVLMTTWNGAAFIGASIASMLEQSFRDFELIVMDDGATDETPRVLARLGIRG
jgi:glycosyltransferase involved in cell wall biosynthesis